MSRILFKEEQQYKKPRILYIITAVTLLLLLDMIILIRQILIERHDAVNGDSHQPVLILVMGFLVLFTAGFLFLFLRKKLVTVINQRGLELYYPPLHSKGKIISKDKIEQFEVRQYNPLWEYGGWGIKPRFRLLRSNRFGDAYTAYGKTGIQLYLNDGSKILVGTQRPDPFKYALSKLCDPKDLHSNEKAR